MQVLKHTPPLSEPYIRAQLCSSPTASDAHRRWLAALVPFGTFFFTLSRGHATSSQGAAAGMRSFHCFRTRDRPRFFLPIIIIIHTAHREGVAGTPLSGSGQNRPLLDQHLDPLGFERYVTLLIVHSPSTLLRLTF